MQHFQKSQNALCVATSRNLREKLRPVRKPKVDLSSGHSQSRFPEEISARDFEGDNSRNEYVDADFAFLEDGVHFEGSIDRVDEEERDLEDHDGDGDGEYEEIFETGPQNHMAPRAHPSHEDAAVDVIQVEMDVDEGEGGAGHAPGGISVKSQSSQSAPHLCH